MSLLARFLGDPAGYVFGTEHSPPIEKFGAYWSGQPSWVEARRGETVVLVDLAKAYLIEEEDA